MVETSPEFFDEMEWDWSLFDGLINDAKKFKGFYSVVAMLASAVTETNCSTTSELKTILLVLNDLLDNDKGSFDFLRYIRDRIRNPAMTKINFCSRLYLRKHPKLVHSSRPSSQANGYQIGTVKISKQLLPDSINLLLPSPTAPRSFEDLKEGVVNVNDAVNMDDPIFELPSPFILTNRCNNIIDNNSKSIKNNDTNIEDTNKSSDNNNIISNENINNTIDNTTNSFDNNLTNYSSIKGNSPHIEIVLNNNVDKPAQEIVKVAQIPENRKRKIPLETKLDSGNEEDIEEGQVFSPQPRNPIRSISPAETRSGTPSFQNNNSNDDKTPPPKLRKTKNIRPPRKASTERLASLRSRNVGPLKYKF